MRSSEELDRIVERLTSNYGWVSWGEDINPARMEDVLEAIIEIHRLLKEDERAENARQEPGAEVL